MKLSKQDLADLAEQVRLAIVREFAPKHLSGNLMNTIEIKYDSEDKLQIVIPAEVYNMYQYFMHGAIVPSQRGGSYASRLNDEGSTFMVYWNKGRKLVEPRNHIGYVERVINSALNEWLIKNANKWELNKRIEV